MAALVNLDSKARGQHRFVYACISGFVYTSLVADRASIYRDVVVERSEAINVSAWAAMVASVSCTMRWRAACTDRYCLRNGSCRSITLRPFDYIVFNGHLIEEKVEKA